MHVVATAGHVDHGKSTLLRALTGMEPDRWAEERRRGLTIDLGFVWTSDPDVAFVDVPGHERFLANMLAGVGPVPAVLFVVAADGGWQVQSEEHLTVLDTLGIRHGVLAVTRADLADPAPVLAEAAERLGRTSLGEVEAVAVSAVTGQGLSGLRAALGRLTAALPVPDPSADVRLWIDRAFTVDGRGVVVTGTLGHGTLRTAQTLEIAGAGELVEVRGLHSLKVAREEVRGPARVAVNLRGRAAAALRRGDALVDPDRWAAVGEVDVRLDATGAAARSRAARVPAQLVWHVGSAAVPARVRPLGSGAARVTLSRPLPLRLGDRALLRDPGNRHVYGVTLLDVRPPALGRRGAARARAAELATLTGVPDGAAELRRRGLMRRADLLAMGASPPGPPVAGDWLADGEHWAGLRDRLLRLVEEHDRAHPEDPGLTPEAVRQALGLPDRALVDALAAGTPLRRRRGRLAAALPVLPARLRGAVAAVRRDLAAAPFAAPDAGRLAELELDARALAIAEAAGALLRVQPGVVLLPGAPEEAARVLAGLAQPFTVAQARQAMGTSRRVALAVLQCLDGLGRTRRVDDTHRMIVG
ncbi:SelB domain-containing protein [Nonomuraea indica]|uniref:SelB C-terminal domain-containing protein n=1 Tax=Nonomuraea indica TaxID=1581193 RepID=A0ABW8A9Q7_9ACTN